MNEQDIIDRLEDEAKSEIERTEGEIRTLLQLQQQDFILLLGRLDEGWSPWSNIHTSALLEAQASQYKAWMMVLRRIKQFKQLRRIEAVKNTQASGERRD